MSGDIFFILGAGASVDSGLPTYRGPNGLYQNKKPYQILDFYNSNLSEIWDFLKPLYLQIYESTPGPTYTLIKEIGQTHLQSFIFTQNIDMMVRSTGIPYVEMHGDAQFMKCNSCKTKELVNLEDPKCPQCGILCRPNVVLFNEDLPEEKVRHTFKTLKRPFKYVCIVGTSMQFPYLTAFIHKAKHRGAKVVHINPDPSYRSNVQKNEIWIQKNAAEGLQDFSALLIN